LREPRKLSSIVVHAFFQTTLGKEVHLPANSRNRNSEYLPQRRKGRKGRRKNVKIIRKKYLYFPFELGAFAPWREKYSNPRIFDFWNI